MIDDGDPRWTDDYVRERPGTNDVGDLTLVGVVHDHPASKYRVKAVVEAVDPDVLALELPPVAVPLFERYADDPRTPPSFGGEMSTAIQAAATDEVAGIDGPTVAFLASAVRTLYREDASIGTGRRLLRSLSTVTRHAIVCRIAATVAGRTGVRLEVDAPVAHDCGWHDDPERQAADERDQVRRATAVANVFGTPDAVCVRESAREAHMADRLSSLRSDGTVVAVVGIDHLDPLTERLRDSDTSDSG